jgi:hypothetical protein
MIARRKPAVGDRRDPLSPSPKDVGIYVTIGIALRPIMGNEFIVTVSDMRVSLGDTVGGLDLGTIKDLRIDDHWGFLFAAEEIGYVWPIRDRARQILSDLPGRHTLAQVRASVTNAYHSVRTEAAFNKYIRMYDFESMADFIKTSTRLLGSEITSGLLKDVREFDLCVSLLVYGFDEDSEIHFIEIRNPGEPIDRDTLVYWAIGSGAHMAMGALTRRTSLPVGDVACVYRAFEAKFSSQLAYGVGETTSIIVWYANGTTAVIPFKDFAPLQKIVDLARDPPIPDDASRLIFEGLRSTKIEPDSSTE